MNWLGRRWVHASPERSRWRSISPCIRVKRNAESTAAFRPENLTTCPAPALLAASMKVHWVSAIRGLVEEISRTRSTPSSAGAEGLGQQHVALDEFHDRNFR